MRLSFVVIALGVVASSSNAYADSAVATDQVSGGSSAYTQQLGIGNVIGLDQTNGAVASISQTGNNNLAGLQQSAGDSVTSIQIGNGLSYKMEQSPNAGHVTIIQHR